MIAPSPNDETIDNPQEYEGPVKALLRLTETAGFLRSTDGWFYAQVSVGGRRDIYALRSTVFRDWLIDRYLRACREVPSDWAIRRVLGALEATARFEGGTPSIFIRVGHDGNDNGDASDCYLDLGDPSGHAVKIGPEGWSVVDNPRVHFRRPAGHLPLPAPSREGSIELLRPYVNLSESDFRLLIVWMAAAIRPVGPYPVLERLVRNPHRAARPAHHARGKEGSYLTPVAKSAFIARQGTASHCPPAPLARHIRCFREKPRKTSDHPHKDESAEKPPVPPK